MYFDQHEYKAHKNWHFFYVFIVDGNTMLMLSSFFGSKLNAQLVNHKIVLYFHLVINKISKQYGVLSDFDIGFMYLTKRLNKLELAK